MHRNKMKIREEMKKVNDGLKAMAIIMAVGFGIVTFFLISIYSGQAELTSGQAELTEKVENVINNRFFSDILNKMGQSVVFIQSGTELGTGFVIREDGYILTASHVINDPNQISITLQNQTTLSGSLYKSDVNNRDLAIIKVNTKLIPVKISSSALLVQEGTRIGLIGYPFGFQEQNVNEGIISFFGFEDSIKKIKISSLIHPGDSGGPLFLSSTGEVIAVFTRSLGIETIKIDVDPKTISDPDIRTLAKLVVESHNYLAKAIEDTSQTGMGEAVPIDINILNELP